MAQPGRLGVGVGVSDAVLLVVLEAVSSAVLEELIVALGEVSTIVLEEVVVLLEMVTTTTSVLILVWITVTICACVVKRTEVWSTTLV